MEKLFRAVYLDTGEQVRITDPEICNLPELWEVFWPNEADSDMYAISSVHIEYLNAFLTTYLNLGSAYTPTIDSSGNCVFIPYVYREIGII